MNRINFNEFHHNKYNMIHSFTLSHCYSLPAAFNICPCWLCVCVFLGKLQLPIFFSSHKRKYISILFYFFFLFLIFLSTEVSKQQQQRIEFNVPVEYTNNTNFQSICVAFFVVCVCEYVFMWLLRARVALTQLIRSYVRTVVRTTFVRSLYVLGNTKLNNFEFLPNSFSFWTNRNDEKIIINIWCNRFIIRFKFFLLSFSFVFHSLELDFHWQKLKSWITNFSFYFVT